MVHIYNLVAILAELRIMDTMVMALRCTQIHWALSSIVILPQVTNSVDNEKYAACTKAVQLLQCTQPSMLDRRISIYTEGDGNCMFRAISQAVFCTQDYHMQLRVLECLEVELYRPTYDKSSQMCHTLLSRDILLPPTFSDLWANCVHLDRVVPT